MVSSVCGIFDCQICVHLKRQRCSGCADGNISQVAEGHEPCALYRCATDKGLASCTDCREAVCPYPRNLEMVCPVRAYFEKKRCYTRKLSDHFLRLRMSKEVGNNGGAKVSEKTINRLQSYLFALDEFLTLGVARVSSEDISRKVGIKDYLIRHDLNQFGEFGRPSIGYDAQALRDCLSEILGLDNDKNIIWVGASQVDVVSGLLARFKAHRFNLVAVFDTENTGVPSGVKGLEVLTLDKLAETIEQLQVGGAILAVSQESAQPVTDLLVAAGIRGILNVTPAVVIAPPDVCVRHMDIVAELCTLAYQCRTMHDGQEDCL